MSEVDWLKSLDRDRGDARDIDVADRVMRDIRLTEARSADDPLAWSALFATVAGGVAVVALIQSIGADPFNGFLDAFHLVLQ